MDYGARFEQGLPYAEFLAKYGDDSQKMRWQAMHKQVVLTEAQKELLKSFKREMKVLVLAGTWCGDCVNQCPIFEHFTAASPKIHIHYFDRDASPDLCEELSICGAARVPSVLFLSEDNYACGLYGDRTLSKYRDMVQTFQGAACPSGIVGLEPSEGERTLLQNVTQEWLNEFERIQHMLRTSGRLRKLHGD